MKKPKKKKKKTILFRRCESWTVVGGSFFSE